MAEVRAAFAVLDPVPESVLAAAREAISWREPDARQAELVVDSHAVSPGGHTQALSGVRGTSRSLTFDGPDLAVEIEVNGTGQDREIVGRLSPPAPAQVRIRHPGGEVTARVDRAGHFLVPGVPAGLVSLVFRLPDTTSIVTSWVRL